MATEYVRQCRVPPAWLRSRAAAAMKCLRQRVVVVVVGSRRAGSGVDERASTAAAAAVEPALRTAPRCCRSVHSTRRRALGRRSGSTHRIRWPGSRASTWPPTRRSRGCRCAPVAQGSGRQRVATRRRLGALALWWKDAAAGRRCRGWPAPTGCSAAATARAAASRRERSPKRHCSDGGWRPTHSLPRSSDPTSGRAGRSGTQCRGPRGRRRRRCRERRGANGSGARRTRDAAAPVVAAAAVARRLAAFSTTRGTIPFRGASAASRIRCPR
mmetsp:Transcript_15615/g.48363  ORF Transcript_15615/g.48363 Transcript_15615/m.48363 type:complete len:271 (+) Transcript_15615:614-1426(+)